MTNDAVNHDDSWDAGDDLTETDELFDDLGPDVRWDNDDDFDDDGLDDDGLDDGELDLAQRRTLRRVAGLSTELDDVSEVECTGADCRLTGARRPGAAPPKARSGNVCGPR